MSCWERRNQCADATQHSRICQDLTYCLSSMMDWMRVNKLELNCDKMEALLVSRKSDSETGIQSILEGVALPLSSQVHCPSCQQLYKE